MYGKLHDFCLLKDAFVQSCYIDDTKKTVAISNLTGELKYSQSIPVCLYRMCGCGENKFIAVDENFNIIVGDVTDSNVELEELEVPLELSGRAVRLISSGEDALYLSYMQTTRDSNDALLFKCDLRKSCS